MKIKDKPTSNFVEHNVLQKGTKECAIGSWPWIHKYIRSFASLLFTIFIALCFRSFVFEPFNVPSGSMKSTLLEGDYIVVNKYAYGYSRYSLPFHVPLIRGTIFKKPPTRGDIVVFVPEKLGGIYYVKRVIGMPGDTIQILDGVLHINGIPAERQFTDIYTSREKHSSIRLKRYVETLDNGVSYNILQSMDTVFTQNTPKYTVPKGKYFMMGDNRDHSRDSRFLQDIGYIPEERLVGKAFVVAFSLSPYERLYDKIRYNRTFMLLNSNIKP